MPYKDPEKRRICSLEGMRRYRKRHPERARQSNLRSGRRARKRMPDVFYMYDLLRYLSDPDSVHARNRRTYARNIEKRRAYDKARYNDRQVSGYSREAKKRHYRNRPEVYARQRVKRQARAALLPGVDQSTIRKIYARAAELRQWFHVVVDHIIPLVKGGLHRADNLQIIYKKENGAKHARLDYVPSVIFT